MLESLIHFSSSHAPPNMVYFEVQVPDSVAVHILTAAALPLGWPDYPAPPTLAELGDKWVAGSSTLILEVPSVVSPHGLNRILNSSHPDIVRLTLGPRVDLVFDPRLLR